MLDWIVETGLLSPLDLSLRLMPNRNCIVRYEAIYRTKDAPALLPIRHLCFEVVRISGPRECLDEFRVAPASIKSCPRQRIQMSLLDCFANVLNASWCTPLSLLLCAIIGISGSCVPLQCLSVFTASFGRTQLRSSRGSLPNLFLRCRN